MQQQSKNDHNSDAFQLQNALEQMNATMQVVADQQEEMTELREQLARLEEKQAQIEDAPTIEKTKKLVGKISRKEKNPRKNREGSKKLNNLSMMSMMVL